MFSQDHPFVLSLNWEWEGSDCMFKEIMVKELNKGPIYRALERLRARKEDIKDLKD